MKKKAGRPPTATENTKNITVSMYPKLLEALRKRAKELKRPVSTHIQHLVEKDIGDNDE